MKHCKPKKTNEKKGRGPEKTLLLMGLPNVGKSAIFSRLTGLDVMVSNYSGTTVDFTEGPVRFAEQSYMLKDVPGVYDIKKSVDEAEQVAINMLEDRPDGIIFVLDALNLESSLHLLMQVLEYGIPTVVALNRNDLSASRGFTIDHRVIQSRLNVPVIPTVALYSESLDLLRYKVTETMMNPKTDFLIKEDEDARWAEVERIVAKAVRQRKDADWSDDKHSYLIKPFPGILIALVVLSTMFAFVIGVGMGLRQFILMPLLRGYLFPFIENAVGMMEISPVLSEMLIGDYGFLIKGIEWPFALVLPYVITFYAALSLLEDSGYLPRLAVLLDGLLKKIGLSGSSIIPLLLGYGCGIPAIMSTRSLPSRKARLIVVVMVSFAVPCVSQTGAFIALLSAHSLLALFSVFFISIFALIIVGLVLDKVKKEAVPFTLMELPHLLVPKPALLAKKIFLRVRHYIKDGAVPMIIAILFTAVLYELGAFNVLGQWLSPLVSGWLRLPEEAATPLIIGIVRRELTVLPLIEMELTTLQFFTGAIVALFYVPCIAMIATIAKEFNVRTAVGILIFTTFTAIFLGGLLARVGGWLALLM